MAQTKYKAKPGKFLLVEVYLGCSDRVFPVETREDGDNLTTERFNFYRRADAEDLASWHLFDDEGNELPRLDKVA